MSDISTRQESSVESMTSWYGLHYHAQRIPEVPRQIVLGSSGGLYVLDYAGDDDEDLCWGMVKDCRERGDNVGVVELLNEEELTLHFRFCVPLLLRRVKPDTTESLTHGLTEPLTHRLIEEKRVGRDSVERENDISALILIQPSIYARTVDTCLAHIRLYVTNSLSRDQSIYSHLLRLAVTFSSQLDLGYTRCITNIAASLPLQVAALRREGFQVVATIPDGVKLHGLGTSDDLIMSKLLEPSPRPRRSSADIELLCKRYAEEGRAVIQSLREGGMLPLPFLPKPYVYQNGFKIIVRPLEFSESELAYSVWKSAASKGQGYGQDECPTLETFQLIMLTDHYCIAFDDAATSHLVGLTFISDSWYTRNPETRQGETSLFLTEEYRGRGLGPESTHIGLLLLKQLGYTATLNDTLLSNTQMFKALKRSPLPPVAVGVIPDGTYTAGRGWDDQVILLADYSLTKDLVQGFVEASEKSLDRESTNSSKL